MPTANDQLTRHTDTPFLGSRAVAEGRVTKGRLQGSHFVRLHQDTYVGACADLTVRVRVLAASLRAGPDGVVGGPLAALAWKVDCPWDDAEAVVNGARGQGRDNIRLRTCRLADDEIATRFGVAVTSPERTAFDLARREGALPDVVAAVDAVAHRCRFDRSSIDRLVAAHPCVRGLVRARHVADLMDPRAESLPESRLRLLVVLRGLPAPVVQYPVVLPDGVSYRLDLAWPDVKVAIEYDGEDHRTPERHAADLDRELELGKLGWYVIHVTGRQLYRRPEAVIEHVTRRLGL